MEQTPLPPLVSEYDIQNLWDDVVRPVVKAMEKQLGQCSPAFQAGEMARAIIPIYEADRAKTREVVQALVDALGELRYGADLGAIEWDCQCEEDAGITCGPCESFERGYAAIALAKSQMNIEPTKP